MSNTSFAPMQVVQIQEGGLRQFERPAKIRAGSAERVRSTIAGLV